MDSQYKKEMDILKKVQGRATKLVRELGNVPCVQRLRDLSSSSLKKRRFQGDFIAACNYLFRGYTEIEARLFLEAHSKQTRGNK